MYLPQAWQIVTVWNQELLSSVVDHEAGAQACARHAVSRIQILPTKDLWVAVGECPHRWLDCLVLVKQYWQNVLVVQISVCHRQMYKAQHLAA